LTESAKPTLNYDRVQPLRRIRIRTVFLSGTLGITLIILMAGGVGSVMVAHVWTLYKDGKPWNPTENDVANVLVVSCDYAFFWAAMLTAVALMIWMYRSHKDLRKFSHTRLRFTPMMAIFGWLVPYWCVIRPYEVMREIFAVSHGESIRQFRPLVGCWWGFLLLAVCASLFGIVAFSGGRMDPTDSVIAHSTLQVVQTFLFVVAGILLLVIVYKIDHAQAKMEKPLST
jgi:hypothetical protein